MSFVVPCIVIAGFADLCLFFILFRFLLFLLFSSCFVLCDLCRERKGVLLCCAFFSILVLVPCVELPEYLSMNYRSGRLAASSSRSEIVLRIYSCIFFNMPSIHDMFDIHYMTIKATPQEKPTTFRTTKKSFVTGATFCGLNYLELRSVYVQLV